MAHNNSLKTATLSLSIVAPTSATRESVHETYFSTKLNYTYNVPSDDSDNSGSGKTGTFTSSQSTDSGNWYTYEMHKIEFFSSTGGAFTSEGILMTTTKSGTGSFGASYQGKIKKGEAVTLNASAILYYTAINHTWYTYLSNKEDVYKTVTETTTDAEGNTTTTTKQVYDHTNYTYSLHTNSPSSQNHTTTATSSNKPPCYGRAGAFSMDCAKGHTIQSSETGGLTADKVNGWADHCGKYRSWYDQANEYSIANGCKVKQGDVISATWYNACVDAIGGKGQVTVNKVTGMGNPPTNTNATIITADIINLLGSAINKSG